MIDKLKIISAENFFYKLHDVDCNQKYGDGLPYSFHLKAVVSIAKKFIHLIDDADKCDVIIACLGHDSIEDARLTYNDIKNRFGEKVADIIYLCTEDKGRNRDERKSESWYNELRNNNLAVFVKLCDIIANSTYSYLTNSSMLNKYESEYHQKVTKYLYEGIDDLYEPMFNELETIYDLTRPQ